MLSTLLPHLVALRTHKSVIYAKKVLEDRAQHPKSISDNLFRKKLNFIRLNFIFRLQFEKIAFIVFNAIYYKLLE
jgi:hypothetical protein